MKPVQIFDSVVRMPKVPNITTQPRYARLVSSIEHLRERLMQDETLREPLLYILESLYKSKKTKEIISRIRPTKPTHKDVIRFVDEFWPDLHKVEATQDGSGQWDQVRDHKYSGVNAMPNVEIIAPLMNNGNRL
jgi:hypothetical protein